MKKLIFAMLALASFGFAGDPEPKVVTKHIDLLKNGNLEEHWYRFCQKTKLQDPQNVFTAEGSTIKVNGLDYGCVTTKEAFRDYKLTLEFRYVGDGELNRKGKARDGGILFHSTGEDGAWYGIWQTSFEYNIIQGAAGDLIVVGSKKTAPGVYRVKGRVDEATRGKESQHWDPKGTEIQLVDGGRIRRCDVDLNWKDLGTQPVSPNENPIGEWNKAEVICRGDKATFIFNGKVVGEYYDLNPTGGRIQLQSEAQGIEYRNITLDPLDK